MFRDECEISVSAGRGGDGCLSFRREKYVPRGGPDGGDGADGGSVIMEATEHLHTLTSVSHRRRYKAGSGQPGQSNNRTGRQGEDCLIQVPVGTQVFDRDTGYLLRDLKTLQERVCVARGGKGGKGNRSFASSTNQAPRQTTEGEEGEARNLRLTLKLIADVGLAGLPNAGKSTLLSRLSNARPRVADYPFTTLEPSLGIVEMGDYSAFVMADIPGLIEGAHLGAGLGDQFLRHIERTRLILIMVDMCPPQGSPSPAEAARIVMGELAAYSPDLAAKPRLLAANKMDVPESTAALDELRRAYPETVIPISAVTGLGLPDLLSAIGPILDRDEMPFSPLN
jgi:GTP-binding protein